MPSRQPFLPAIRRSLNTTRRSPSGCLEGSCRTTDWWSGRGDGYRLTLPLSDLTEAQRDELIRICDAKVDDYLQRRGAQAYDHRRTALGELSGTVRYQVLSRAGFRCELCGVPADEQALEVDHIMPRRHGGQDDETNLQALCWRCNANKGARDATDFRAVRAALGARDPNALSATSTLDASSARTAWRWPSEMLIQSHRCIRSSSLADMPRHGSISSVPEQRAINLLLDTLRKAILSGDDTVLGFNIGMNCGEVAGQTVLHAHVHLIPRRRGDVKEPRGGVRGVVPGKASY